MTVSKARRATGLDIRKIDEKTWGAWNEENCKVAEASHRKMSIALTLLVDQVYKMRRQQAMDRDGWKCIYCGSRQNLQAHHRQHRSKGRNDCVDNLETCCNDCHRQLHQRKAA